LNLRERFGRLASTTSTTCGITSPARWMITLSPSRISLRSISSSLCRVARATTTPPTLIGFRLATGVSVPVRPTWIVIFSSTVSARSAGNLCASAQRGARLTMPSRACQSRRFTL